jgi:hypothetical protein
MRQFSTLCQQGGLPDFMNSTDLCPVKRGGHTGCALLSALQRSNSVRLFWVFAVAVMQQLLPFMLSTSQASHV